MRTREDILWDIEHYTKLVEEYTDWADTKWAEHYPKLAEACTKRAADYTKCAEDYTKLAEEAKQELKEFDELKEQGDE